MNFDRDSVTRTSDVGFHVVASFLLLNESSKVGIPSPVHPMALALKVSDNQTPRCAAVLAHNAVHRYESSSISLPSDPLEEPLPGGNQSSKSKCFERLALKSKTQR